MVLKNCLTILSLILLSSCSLFAQEEEIVTRTEFREPNIEIIERPQPLNLGDLQFQVVTEENLEEFKQEFIEENGLLVFYAMSVRDYETLSNNMAEIRTYILRQKEIIEYYEDSIKDIGSQEERDEN